MGQRAKRPKMITLRLGERAQRDYVTLRDWLGAQTLGGMRASATAVVHAALRIATQFLGAIPRGKTEDPGQQHWPDGTVGAPRTSETGDNGDLK